MPRIAQPPTLPLQLDLFRTPEESPRDVDRPAVVPQPTPQYQETVGATCNSLLERRLEALMPGRLRSLTLTDNRSSIVSARAAAEDPPGDKPADKAADRLDVRIHRCFADAPDETLRSVAEFLLRPSGRSAERRDALAVIREFFTRHRPPAPAAARRRRRTTVLQPVGRALDLCGARDRVNQRYFAGELEVRITWGRAASRRRSCGGSVRLGSYSARDNTVRIHRCLDHAGVPRYVVESVVHHEMLHAALPPVIENDRRRIHTPEFRRRERLFRSHERAERWIGRNLTQLLRRR